jgi:tetratricopeptide (TPR) repeat protein
LDIKENIHRVALSPDGRFAGIAFGTQVQLYHLETGLQAAEPLAHPRPVSCINFSPDSRLLVSACADKTHEGWYAQVWSVESGTPRPYKLRHRDGVLYAAFSPDGKLVVTCGEDFTACLWDVRTGNSTAQHMKHIFQVAEARFSRDSRWLVTASSDQTARVWDVASGEAITPPFSHPGRVLRAQFIEQNRAIMTTTPERQYVWDISPDQRSIAGIQRMAEFQSGHSVGQEELVGNLAKLKLEGLLVSSRTTNTLLWHERQADAAERQKSYFAAEFHLTRQLQAKPHNGALHVRRGLARAALEKWQPAEEDFRAGLVAEPGSVSTWTYYARVCLALGKVEELCQARQEILRLCASQKRTSELFNAALLLGLAPCEQGNAELLALLTSLQAIFPNERKVLLAQSATLLRSEQPEQALKVLSSNLKSSGMDVEPEALLLSAMAYLKLGRPDRAVTCQKPALDWMALALEEKPVPDTGIVLSWERKLELKTLAQQVDTAFIGSTNSASSITRLVK